MMQEDIIAIRLAVPLKQERQIRIPLQIRTYGDVNLSSG